MSDNNKAFKVKLQLWENQAKAYTFLHFLHIKYLKTFFPEHIQEHARKIFLLREEFDERFKDFTNMEPELMLFVLPLKADTEKPLSFLIRCRWYSFVKLRNNTK
jgi:hypothetical protein